MARADLFKKPLLKKILNFLKIIPIYRIRDGVEELSKNDETFNTCLDILRDCHSVCLMPEGNHGDKRRLRPLVKGVFRIAFKSQEEFGHINTVKIVPVGIDFEHYTKIQQDLLIIYGKPIEVSDYIEAYRENLAKAMNSLKDRLIEEMQKIIIHIENVEHYDMFMDLREIYNNNMRNRAGIRGRDLYSRFQADKQMIDILDQNFITEPEKMQKLSAQVAEYSAGLNSLNLRNWVIARKGYSFARIFLQSLLLIIFSPVFLFGWLSNYIPYTLPKKMTKTVKDPQFVNSFKFGLALFVFLIYYSIIGILVAVFTEASWIPWAVMEGMLLSGYIAINYAFSYKKLHAVIRFRLLLGRGDKQILRLIALHEEIIATMNKITDTFMDFIKSKPERNIN
jgi:hypothetical protein